MERLNADGSPGLVVSRVLAELALLRLEQPSVARASVLRLTPGLPTRHRRSSSCRRSGPVGPSRPSRWPARSSTPRRVLDGGGNPAERALEPADVRGDLRRTRRARSPTGAPTSTPSRPSSARTARCPTSRAVTCWSPPRPSSTTPSGEAHLDAPRGPPWRTSPAASTTPRTFTLTLTAREGTIPLTIRNDSGVPLQRAGPAEQPEARVPRRRHHRARAGRGEHPHRHPRPLARHRRVPAAHRRPHPRRPAQPLDEPLHRPLHRRVGRGPPAVGRCRRVPHRVVGPALAPHPPEQEARAARTRPRNLGRRRRRRGAWRGSQPPAEQPSAPIPGRRPASSGRTGAERVAPATTRLPPCPYGSSPTAAATSPTRRWPSTASRWCRCRSASATTSTRTAASSASSDFYAKLAEPAVLPGDRGAGARQVRSRVPPPAAGRRRRGRVHQPQRRPVRHDAVGPERGQGGGGRARRAGRRLALDHRRVSAPR